MSDQIVRRVLLTTDTVGGVWTFSLDLARQFARSGVQVVLAALGGFPTSQQIADAQSVPELCLLSTNFKVEWMADPWADIEESGRWLLRLEREYHPDLVHLNSFGHGDLPWSTPVIVTAHSCVLSWWKAVKGEAAPGTWNRYRELVTRSLNAADLITCPTSAMGNSLVEEYGSRPSRMQVIPNGSSISLFRTAEKDPFVLTAGRLWDEAKNVTAVAHVAKELPWPVFAAGETEDPDGRNTKLDGVHLLGRLHGPDLAAWYSRAAIFALPCRYEPFGLSILEAALSGCALVLGDIPSLREVWGDAALFVPADDEGALRDAIRSLISDAQFREKMSCRSYQRALTFDSARTAELYLEAYNAVFSAKGVPCAS